MTDEPQATENYDASHKLAVVLACLAGVMAIILFLLEKTRITVVGLLAAMLGLSIYPIFHFARARIVRVFLIFAVTAGAVLFGWEAWPRPQAEAPSSQQSNVQQSNNGNNDTNINGNGNTVTNKTVVIKRNDPRAQAQLDRIEKLLQNQQDQITPKILLARYPLGYVIFSTDYSQQVFPYRSQALQDWDFDWSTVELTDRGNSILLTVPDMRSKRGGSKIIGLQIGAPKKVGPFSMGLIRMGNIELKGEVLALTADGVVFVLGFSQAPQAQPR